MSKKTYMLDTNICSFIMRERPDAVLAKLEQAVTNQHRIVVSAITYSEMRFGAANPKASPKVAAMVDAFIQRLDAILSWDAAAVDQTTQIHRPRPPGYAHWQQRCSDSRPCPGRWVCSGHEQHSRICSRSWPSP